jgi:predicted nucleic acid-binding protein
MRDKVFLDTNIFVYSVDASPDQNEKRDLARKLVTQYIQDDSGVISIQVLQEFYQVATQKIEIPLSARQALEYLHYIAILQTVIPSVEMVVAAILLHQKYSLSFWDALILQAAKTAGCSQLLSEDLQDGFHLDNLIVRNPFTSKTGLLP